MSYGKRIRRLEGSIKGAGLYSCPGGERVTVSEDHGDGRGAFPSDVPTKSAICERCGRERETVKVLLNWVTADPLKV